MTGPAPTTSERKAPDRAKKPAGPGQPARKPDGPLRTRISIRLRSLIAMLLVLAIALTGVVVVASVMFNRQIKAAQGRELNAKIDQASILVRRGDKPANIVRVVRSGGTKVQLRLPDGKVVGDKAPGPGWASRKRVLHGKGPADGATITIWGRANIVREATQTLSWRMTMIAAGALLLAALLALLANRIALRPLDRMADAARTISGGSRGLRLQPVSSRTDIGRTAAAFDQMLDELEGAERRARLAEGRVRNFVADAAHELRTPIAGIQAAAEALIHAPDDESREQLELLLVGETRRSAQLVSDLMDVARLDSGTIELNPAPLDCRPLLEHEKHRLGLSNPQIDVQIHVAGDRPPVASADRVRVEQVLRNLVNNAVRAVTGPANHDAPRILLAVGGHADQVVIEVVDSGPGVAPDQVEAIFERLSRGPERERGAELSVGAGLGLPIARGLARAHGGDLVCLPPGPAANRVLPGAWFRITLPAALPAQPPEQDGAPSQ